ncbi:T9SS type B sorting domain-containing protein [Taibaiella koreensis]|uniref:T9SS type B sorting domain-containing protein n=1 Tax=Taibaiella koreensis TaxID=1268548 RepID=UPI000E59E930|nr:gliding motility-associated C-terminal domain-containing protein [Taibaiella koreensis]
MRSTLLQLLIIVCILFLPSRAGAQSYYNQKPEFLKANSMWALLAGVDGGSVGLNFNTVPATTLLLDTIGPAGQEGLASVADPVTGALLFYSNGATCWNADNEVMLNGDMLMGNYGPPSNMNQDPLSSTTQGVCIVPFINEPGKYYLFSLDGPTNWQIGPQPNAPFLYYSVVDMSLDGGLGGIVPGQKNIPLGNNIPLSESMIAIPGDNCDIWLVVHDYINPIFKAYHITQAGVDPTPVVSTAGTQIQGTGGMGAYMTGSMAVSPDRRTIGITSCAFLFGATPGATGALLCRFDPATGSAGTSVQVNQTAMMSYSLAFSPDNTKLYLAILADSNSTIYTSHAGVLQYEISIFDSAAIAASQVSVGEVSSFLPGCFKSYDGKIYLNSFLGPDLYVINQPNLPGMACNYQPYLSNNPGNYVTGGPSLPNEVVYAFPPDTARHSKDTTICLRNNIVDHATLPAIPGYSAYLWDDGSSGSTRGITDTGVYWVLCKDDCHSLIDTIKVKAGSNVSLSLGADTLLCNGGTLTLNATVPGGSYLWQDGSIKATYKVTDSGKYWVRAKAGDCIVADTIVINAIDLRQHLGADIPLCKGEAIPTDLHLQANAPSGAIVLWNTGSNIAVQPVQDTGIYWVTVRDQVCSGTDTVKVTEVICACKVGMPNAVSPNGDGRNDRFQPVIEQGCAVGSYAFHIYNRYGARIYSSANPAAGWDGNYPNGQPADAGTYMYELSFAGGTQQIKYYHKGDLVLIR